MNIFVHGGEENQVGLEIMKEYTMPTHKSIYTPKSKYFFSQILNLILWGSPFYHHPAIYERY